MSIIRVLPDQVANQIAAGEVVERPVAVIKELVENSIDAGAKKIEIEFRQGGKAYMRIEDDGKGMDPKDALLSLERHATSKIQSADDLNTLYSFGFRGEALPSIASVSRFHLQTRPADQEVGTEILINGGKLIHNRECGMPPGTRIEVANLFNTVPARRKFLKADATESAHIIQLTRLFAIAHPEISFCLREGARNVFRSPVCLELKERIGEIYNLEIANNLIPISTEKMGYKLTGLIGKAGTGRATRQEMITLVNHRPVDSKTLNFAIVEAYHSFISKGRYPIAFLFLEINPAEIDINVHPSKKEIRFHNEGLVRNLLIESIIECLQPKQKISASEIPYSNVSPSTVPSIQPSLTRKNGEKPPSKSPQKTTGDYKLKEEKVPKSTLAKGSFRPKAVLAAATQDLKKIPVEKVPNRPSQIKKPTNPFPWSFIGLHTKHLALFEDSNGLIVLHCKAAQERILFEKIERYLQSEQKASQNLLLPIPLELDALANQALEDILGDLHKSGFSIEEFGRNFYRIEAIPAWMEPEEAKFFLIDLIDLVKEQGQLSKSRKVTDEIFTKLATARSSQSKQKLTPGEAIQIAQALLNCITIHTSPTGKPTYFELSNTSFTEKFGRRI